MKTMAKGFIRGGVLAAAMLGCMGMTQAGPPDPLLHFTGAEPFEAGGKAWMRYRYDVINKELLPADMFAPAPDLPPCGTNTNASRSWVDLFDSEGQRLYGFCALPNPASLDQIWFALEQGQPAPSGVYIIIHDRRTGVRYRSNEAWTSESVRY